MMFEPITCHVLAGVGAWMRATKRLKPRRISELKDCFMTSHVMARVKFRLTVVPFVFAAFSVPFGPPTAANAALRKTTKVH